MAEEITNEANEDAKKFSIKNLGMNAWIGIAVAALVIGILVGKFLLGGGAPGALNKTTLTEAELNTVVATYSQNGAAQNLTARDAIEMTMGSLDSAKGEDGNYTVPSADLILYAVRNRIAVSEAEKRGINPTDEQLLEYAEKNLGLSPDFESIATSNNISVDRAKQLLTDSYRASELNKQVAGELDAKEPEFPKEPEYATKNDAGEALSEEEVKKNQEAAYKKANADYAKYIIGLAGDEWDAAGNKWKSADGPYAQALSKYEIKNDSATYEAAYDAYMVAASAYSQKQSEYSEKVKDFLSDMYAKSAISINTLAQ